MKCSPRIQSDFKKRDYQLIKNRDAEKDNSRAPTTALEIATQKSGAKVVVQEKNKNEKLKTSTVEKAFGFKSGPSSRI